MDCDLRRYHHGGNHWLVSLEKVINETGNMMVIDFKRILNKIKLSFEELLETVRNCVGCLDKFWKNLWKLQAKEKYTIVRRLNRCGFNEKEINVMVFGAYHCRNNC